MKINICGIINGVFAKETHRIYVPFVSCCYFFFLFAVLRSSLPRFVSSFGLVANAVRAPDYLNFKAEATWEQRDIRGGWIYRVPYC